MEPIEQEFSCKGVLRGGLLLLKAKDALDMVRRCRELGIEVLGIDGFRITERTTQPLMEESIDLSRLGGGINTWAQAESFLGSRVDTNLFFEVVIAP
jgi:hypothetical protein